MDDIAKELCFAGDATGWKKNLFLQIDEAFVCAICKNVSRDCVELSCDVEHTDEEIEIYCVGCLKTQLASNGNECPINGHPSPSYTISRSSRARILRAKVLCPNSRAYAHGLASDGSRASASGSGNDEGNTAGAGGSASADAGADAVPGAKTGEGTGCFFEGTLNDLIYKHINQCCITQALDNPKLQAMILSRMKKTTKHLSQRVIKMETVDKTYNANIDAVYDAFHADTNLKFDAYAEEILALRTAYDTEEMLQTTIEVQIEANKQEIQQLKDILSGLKRTFNDYKEQQSQVLRSGILESASSSNNHNGNDNNNNNNNTSTSTSASTSTTTPASDPTNTTGKPFDSILMESMADMKRLVSWVPNGKQKRFVLKYRASRDGWQAASFHTKCDGATSSVVVMQGENNNVFGGYTSTTWDQSFRNWKTDNDAFIFLLKSADSSNAAAKYTVTSAATAIYAHSSYGPNWGNGPDLEVKSDQNIVCDLENGSCSFSAPKNNKLFGGNTGRTCRLKDYECYAIV